ncbi:MAG: zinc-binding dehydrogenase [Chitinivibrionales bacterium]|nr:zinc-binding dehydrogenase [Chitinivibrionales bacterium]
MKTLALRLYGKNDLRLENFDLPAPADNEILADITSNSICMSSHKAAEQGPDHKRVPSDIADNPVIVGHEFCGTILEVGAKYRGKYREGSKYSIQPALNYPGRLLDAPGYSFHYTGGQATKIIIPREVLEMNCLLPYEGEGFFKASLSEPASCIIGAFHAQYHFNQGEYVHRMGICKNGSMAIIAGAGPMGLGAIDYALHGPAQPRLLVITDIDQARLDRAAEIFAPSHAKKLGVDLRYVNTRSGNPVEDLRAVNDNNGYDDVFVLAPVAPLVEQASGILGFNGCLNFFAGPTRSDFKASINFYNVHYSGHHLVGTSGGNTDDMKEALDLMAKNVINPAVMVTHIGGIDSAAQTILELPAIPGGKKLIYTQKSMPLFAIDDLETMGKDDPFFTGLAAITAKSKGLWSTEAENYVLNHAKNIEEKGA